MSLPIKPDHPKKNMPEITINLNQYENMANIEEKCQVEIDNLQKVPESAEEQKMGTELGTAPAKTMELPPGHRKLAPELDRQIFLCLNPANVRKFICGLGWDFYQVNRHRVLIKIKRVLNPNGNRWNGTNRTATIAADGLNFIANDMWPRTNAVVFAEQAFPISWPKCRADGFPGTICYYYEIKGSMCIFGLSDGATLPIHQWIGKYPNSYSYISGGFYDYECWLSGKRHRFELPTGAIRRELAYEDSVKGCGLVIDPTNELYIFFTLNGKLFAKKIPIAPTMDCLFPTICPFAHDATEANFGNDPAIPFEYDIEKCPGLELDCL